MRRKGIIALLVCVALPATALADIYMRRGPDGKLEFTDTPATIEGYKVIVRDSSQRMPWREYAHIQARRHNLDPKLVRALIYVESAENTQAVSSKGAQGLMQLMPTTAEELGVADPLMPLDNVRGGVKYFSKMLKRFDGNVELALAAYNAGPGAVERHGGIPPFTETRNFVKKVMDIYKRAAINDG